jgi:hypothetical protein
MSTIFGHNGEIIKSIQAIYGLDLLRWLRSVFDVTHKGVFGRGREARLIQEALKKKFSGKLG